MEHPVDLFRYVRSRGRERDVDRQCIVSAFREAAMLPPSTRMNVNVHASTIADDSDLVQFIAWSARAHEQELSRLVIELIQCGPSTEKQSFHRTIGALRARGVGIALDDIGTGGASYKTALECRPDYLKVDPYLIAGVDGDSSRQAALLSIVDLARGLGSRVIAEGVEFGPELATVREMGIDLVQGLLLAPPRGRSSRVF